MIKYHYSVATWIDAAFGPKMHPYLFVSFSDLCHDKVSLAVVCSMLGSYTFTHIYFQIMVSYRSPPALLFLSSDSGFLGGAFGLIDFKPHK